MNRKEQKFAALANVCRLRPSEFEFEFEFGSELESVSVGVCVFAAGCQALSWNFACLAELTKPSFFSYAVCFEYPAEFRL